MNWDSMLSELGVECLNAPKPKKKESSEYKFPTSFVDSMTEFFRIYLSAHNKAERIGYGEALFEDAETINIFKSLNTCYKQYLVEHEKLTKAPPIQLIKLGIVTGKHYLAEGEKLKKDGILNKDLSSFETGCWYLQCCK